MRLRCYIKYTQKKVKMEEDIALVPSLMSARTLSKSNLLKGRRTINGKMDHAQIRKPSLYNYV